MLYNKSDLTPKRDLEGVVDMSVADRLFLISRLPPHQQLYSFRNCLDRDTHAHDFTPWTQAILPELGAAAWWRNKEQCIRLAVLRILSWMRLHLRYLSEKVNQTSSLPRVYPFTRSAHQFANQGAQAC